MNIAAVNSLILWVRATSFKVRHAVVHGVHLARLMEGMLSVNGAAGRPVIHDPSSASSRSLCDGLLLNQKPSC